MAGGLLLRKESFMRDFLVKTHDTPVDYATERGENALMKAAANGHWEPCTQHGSAWLSMAQHGFSKEVTTKFPVPATAWRLSAQDVCEYLLEEGAKARLAFWIDPDTVNQLDAEHQTALMWAAAFGHAAVVEGLISRDAKVDLPCKGGKTALMMACMLGREAVVQAHTKKGETAIIWAAMQQQLESVRILIAARANLNAQESCSSVSNGSPESEASWQIIREPSLAASFRRCSGFLPFLARLGPAEIAACQLQYGYDGPWKLGRGNSTFDRSKYLGARRETVPWGSVGVSATRPTSVGSGDSDEDEDDEAPGSAQADRPG
eukprot:Skav215093  [mRNA]  locus=scaffold1068:117399:125083:+ [translate_table: standard]